MGTVRSHVPVGRGSLAVCVLVCAFVTMSCGCSARGEQAPGGGPASEVIISGGADVGKTLKADGWVVTLDEAPEKRREVGSGDVDVVTGHYEQYGFTSVVTAEGWWLILGLEVTNDTGDMALVPMKLLHVEDAQGREYHLQGKMVHFPVIWTDERWMDADCYLFSDVIDDGITRVGPLVFDVAEDATGLVLVMRGTDETFDLGF